MFFKKKKQKSEISAHERKLDEAATQYVKSLGSTLDSLLKNIREYRQGIIAWNESSSDAALRKNDKVSDAVSKIITPLSQIPIKLFEGKEILEDHKILKLLKKPNYGQIWQEFVAHYYLSFLPSGNVFVVVTGVKEPLEIYAYHPSFFTYVNDANGVVKEWILQKATNSIKFKLDESTNPEKNGRFFSVDGIQELYLISEFPDPLGDPFGVSRLESLSYKLLMYESSLKHNINLFKNGATLSGILTLMESLDPDLRKELKEDFKRKFQGVDSTDGGGIFVVAGGGATKFETLGVTNREMDYSNLLDKIEASIYTKFDIPLPLVMQQRQTFSNYSESVSNLLSGAVMPQLTLMLAHFSNLLVKRYPDLQRRPNVALGYSPNDIEIIKDENVKQLLDASKTSVFTRNELRRTVGYEDLEDDRGDEIVGEKEPSNPEEEPVKPEDTAKERFIRLMASKGFSDEAIERYWETAN
jgi:HK97 family phage portal protein